MSSIYSDCSFHELLKTPCGSSRDELAHVLLSECNADISAHLATISDKNKEDTSRCVADYPFPLFVTGEGGSNMLWCHDLFNRDCVDYRTVESSTEISLRFGCKDMDVSRLSSSHLGEC